MTASIFAETTAGLAELKRNPTATIAAGKGFPVAILHHDEPVFYCVPAKLFEAMLDELEDMELNAVAEARAGEATIRISSSEL